MLRSLGGLLTGALLCGCSGSVPAERARQAWLVDALVDDNQPWLSRELDPLATKYDRMEDDVYDYLRATAGVFLRDVGRPGTDRSETVFLIDAEASEVLLTGDPHPENLGTLRPSATSPLLLEVNDFDGSVYGPYLFDVRRLNLGLAYLADEGGCGCLDEVVTAASEAYLLSIQDGDDRPALVPGDEGRILTDLVEKATEGGTTQETLAEHTETTASGRRFRILGRDEAGRGLETLSGPEHLQLDRLLSSWKGRPEGFRELSRARRYGSGVASLPAIRFVVAYDLGDPGPEDDALLSIREVVDPPAVPGVHPGAARRWASNAQRVEQTARTLWSRPAADPPYAGLLDGVMSFKVQSWTPWHESLDHTSILRRLEEGSYRASDLVELADRLGGALGRVHASGETARRTSASSAVLRDVAGRGDLFVQERVAESRRDLIGLRRDYRLFVSARLELGPWLGAEQLEAK